jgi:hypothetical protein
VDENGNLYEMNRLPMGLKISPELMQIIVEGLAGHPDTAAESATIIIDKVPQRITLQNPNTSVNVWIDGFAISGDVVVLEQVKKRIETVARYIQATFKEPISIQKEYDFIGIHFNHSKKQVSVASKTLNKLPSSPFKSGDILLTSELEKLVSRLIFCSGVLRIILGNYFFLLKWANRRIAQLNKSGLDAKLTLPTFVARSLNSWMSCCTKSLSLSSSNINCAGYDILFVDASFFGWGAFFISSSGQCAIYGEKWSEEILNREGYNINVLEAFAVEKSLKTFEDRLLVNKNVDLRVDNTSSLSAILKSKSKSSAALNEHVTNVVTFLVNNNFSYTLQYVNTKENWADAPSRGLVVENPTKQQITEVLCHTNRGTYGRQAVITSSVLTRSQKGKKD